MTASTEFSYVGTELELFAKATNWKNYVGRKLRPYIAGSVIEVGAGLGGSTKYLCDRSHVRWLCLDPDANHVSHLKDLIAARKLPPCCEARCGVLADLAPDECADTIIYIDVLEHIENDEGEMRVAATHLAAGGPHRNALASVQFSLQPLRRGYRALQTIRTQRCQTSNGSAADLGAIFFLDSSGYFVSALNRLIMRTSQPSVQQIQIWDKAIVPVSLLTDKIFGRLFGRSVVMIWQKT